MFVRVKPSGKYRYLQIAENHREGKKVKQKILCALGRVDELTENGKPDALAESLQKKLKQGDKTLWAIKATASIGKGIQRKLRSALMRR